MLQFGVLGLVEEIVEEVRKDKNFFSELGKTLQFFGRLLYF